MDATILKNCMFFLLLRQYGTGWIIIPKNSLTCRNGQMKNYKVRNKTYVNGGDSFGSVSQ